MRAAHSENGCAAAGQQATLSCATSNSYVSSLLYSKMSSRHGDVLLLPLLQGGIAKLLAGPEYVTVEDDDAVTELYAGSASPPVERKPSEWLDFDATAITDDHAEAAATHADILDISCGWPVAEAAAGKDSGKEPTDKGDSGPRSGEKYFGAVKSLQVKHSCCGTELLQCRCCSCDKWHRSCS